MEDENRKNIDNIIYRTQEEVKKILDALHIDDKDIPYYSQYEELTYDNYDKVPGYKSLEQLIEEEGCEKGKRVKFDFSDWNALITTDVDVFRKRINEMQLVGRTINDIRFVSHVYNTNEDELLDQLYFVSERYFNESLVSIYRLEDIYDSYPYPLYIQMDEPVLIRFEDGDQFEIETPFTGEFIANMNSIPWDADREVCWENVNPSILLDFCVGGKIQDVIVNETSWNLYEGRRIIGDVTIKFSKDNHIYNMVFDSNVSYMMLSVENDDGFVIHCPVKKLLKSMYKMK